MKKGKSLLIKFFRKKRIVIISDQEIVSLPFGPRLQAAIVLLFISSMVWVSYSSGKYFAYQDLLSVKEKQILNTNLTNETLQYQVSDLHRNLVRLDNYFEQIKKYNQINGENEKLLDGIKDNSSLEPNAATGEEIANLEEGFKDVLVGIHGKVRERINNLEMVISMTGMSLEKIMDKDEEFKRAAARSALDAKTFEGQGGPFIPSKDKKGAASADELVLDPVVFERRLDRNIDYLLRLEEVVHSFPISRPIKGAYISSTFGGRVDPIRKLYAMHNGIDFVGHYKSKVLSTAPGKIIEAKRNGAYGLFIEIDHGNGITTRYGHLSTILVKEGDVIDRGQIIGLQGSTGRSTGSHLHYEIRYNGDPINPDKFLKAGSYVF